MPEGKHYNSNELSGRYLTERKKKMMGGIPTWPGCWPGMAARTLMVVPRGPKAEGGMLGWKEGLVKTTRA